MTEKVSRPAAAQGSELQGPPFPPRRETVAVGAHLHLHERDGELVAFPVVPVDPLGRRKTGMSGPRLPPGGTPGAGNPR